MRDQNQQMQAQGPYNCCYTGLDSEITFDQPGVSCQVPNYMLREFKDLFPSMKKRQIFFGGHPVSITRTSCQQIFTLGFNNESPYLVCQKSDGVRYLLVIARVLKQDVIRPTFQNEQTVTQCYFVSRKGHTALDASVVDVGVSYDIDFASAEIGKQRRSVVSILDGELVQERLSGRVYYKFLIFDCLVHLGRNICNLTLKHRLQCVQKFIRCNQMLGIPDCRIPIQLKDFFRLTNRKFNVIDYLMNKYIRKIQHQNDGLIFNHEQKQYIVGGTNTGYIKWKPQHLNTVDFMVMPNTNLIDQFGRRVLDLYSALHDSELGRYTRQFYTFMVVDQQTFNDISMLVDEREEIKINKMLQAQQQYTQIDQFQGALIAQCNYQALQTLQQRSILSSLTSGSPQEIRSNLMKQSLEERDMQAISVMKKRVFDKNWKIYKLREDKNLPNNSQIVKKIEQSIRDGISKEYLIKCGKTINQKAFKTQ